MAWRQPLLNQFFGSLYGPLAPAYDAISRLGFAGEWQRWQQLALAFADRQPIVELGCGTGQLVSRLTQAGRPVIGLEPATPMLRQARQRASGRLLQASAQALPLRSGSIGTLLSLFPTAYILDPATWQEAERVLQPGGRLVIISAGWLTPDDPWRLLLHLGHQLLYGAAAGAAPPAAGAAPPAAGAPPPAASQLRWPAGPLTATLALVERTAHGYASIHIATR